MHEPPRDIATLTARLGLPDNFRTVNQAVQQAHTQPGSRLIVNMPPRSGKTSRVARIGTLWAIAHDPDRRYGLITYSQGAAQLLADRIADASLRLPDLCPPFLAHPRLSKHDIAGHRGTLRPGATGSKNLTGPIDTLILDDPFATVRREQLTSTHADRAWDWWQTSAATRLAPHATVIVVETPHEHSLTSRLLDADPDTWTVITTPTPAT